MVLRIQNKTNNYIFKVYLLAMFALMVFRYLLGVSIPSIAFLLVAMLPMWFGTTSEQLALVASFIPISVTFQYKYALLILAVAILIRHRWKLKRSCILLIVALMMIWELWHAFYGRFSYVEYLRDFAELIILGIVTSIDLHNVDHKLVIRSLAISVVGVCLIMLLMQLQQFDYNLLAVFARSAKNYRFGEINMEAETFALNFNANNLGFICNLSICGCLMLAVRKEHRRVDLVLLILAAVFALMTMSRAAVICLIMIFAAYLIFVEGDFIKKIWRGFGGILVLLFALVILQIFAPSVFLNIQERFQRSDVWNGRGNLFKYYNQHLFSSPMHFLFGIGMQSIFEKVSPHFPVLDVPHMGLQEVWVAWGIVGLSMMLIVFWKIITISKQYAGGKRQAYQIMPLVLTLVFTMAGQLLTSSRTLMALAFAYVCLCVKKTAPMNGKNTEIV